VGGRRSTAEPCAARGVDADALDEAVDNWSLVDGELEFTEVVDETKATGSLSGRLSDEKGKAAGRLDVTFTATWCEVPL
jgi:hypothetical protein